MTPPGPSLPRPAVLAGSQRPEAARVLARAFQDDPLMVHLLPDPARRGRGLPGFLGGLARCCLRYGEVHAAPGLAGVACWLPPGKHATTWRHLRTGGLAMPRQLGGVGLRRVLAVQAYLGREHARHAPEPHWYLYLLGVEPVRQGCGVGRALLTPVLARADATGVPCYLETQNPRNVGFYRRLGFRVMSDGVVPGTGLRVWTMRREPVFS